MDEKNMDERNMDECEALKRANKLAQELLDRDWLEMGVAQEELEQNRLLMQEFYASLRQGDSVDDIVNRWNSETPAEVNITSPERLAS